jgi:hypothetical protein
VGCLNGAAARVSHRLVVRAGGGAAGASRAATPRAEEQPPLDSGELPTAAVTTLPAGAGAAILERACTGCHTLDRLDIFRGYYTAAHWTDVVVTMVDLGTELEPGEMAVLVDYLTEHYGPHTR